VDWGDHGEKKGKEEKRRRGREERLKWWMYSIPSQTP